MKRKYWLLLLVFAVLLHGGRVLADSDFYVIAGGGGVGTKITSLPYTISKSGFYYLGGDLINTTTWDAITVNADHVTIDLMGFGVTRSGDPGTTMGIYINGRNNVEVRNGTVRGFFVGIMGGGIVNQNHRVVNIRAMNNVNSGINLGGTNNLVKNCHCSNNANGLLVKSGTIINCTASDNSNGGITLTGSGSVLDNIANNNGDNNFLLGDPYASKTLLIDRNSAFGGGANYSVYYGTEPQVVWGVNAGR